jgi:hypothetical protein
MTEGHSKSHVIRIDYNELFMCKMSLVGNGITTVVILHARSRIYSNIFHRRPADTLSNSCK